MPYENIAVPEELAKRLQQGFLLNTAPRTLGELANTEFMLGVDCSPDALISGVPTRHEVRFEDERLYTHCVVDTFALPSLRGKVADIRSIDPVTGQEICFLVTPQGLEREDENLCQAVVSIGAAASEPGSGYTTCCPFINLFSSPANYEEWVGQHPEVLAVVLPLKDAIAMAQAWLPASLADGCCNHNGDMRGEYREANQNQ
jgi:hypothetical protein